MQEPTNKDTERRTRRITACVFAVLIALACLIYFGLIVSGAIQTGNRLKIEDVALVLIACFFVVLLIYPEALSRLSLIKLPGGIEMTLERIKETQHAQQTDLNSFYRILATLLSDPEKFHLRALHRGGQEYTGCQSLRNELLRLKRFGLIEEIPGQKIGDFFDAVKANPTRFVRLTETGTKFIEGLDEIERQ